MNHTICRIFALLLLLVFIVVIVLALTEAEGAEIPDNMWKALLLEAASEGYDGLYAVACCYRNRLDKGLPLGCSGLNRPNIDKWIDKNTTKKHQDWAKSIVNKVFMIDNFIDKIDGATYYESTDFPVPSWAKDMQIVCKVGKHVFYKPKEPQ